MKIRADAVWERSEEVYQVTFWFSITLKIIVVWGIMWWMVLFRLPLSHYEVIYTVSYATPPFWRCENFEYLLVVFVLCFGFRILLRCILCPMLCHLSGPLENVTLKYYGSPPPLRWEEKRYVVVDRSVNCCFLGRTVACVGISPSFLYVITFWLSFLSSRQYLFEYHEDKTR